MLNNTHFQIYQYFLKLTYYIHFPLKNLLENIMRQIKRCSENSLIRKIDAI